MEQYHNLLKRVLGKGDPQYNERTGQLMIVSAGDQSVYDLRDGFPLVTTKPSAPIRWVAEELNWMLRGERNAKTLDATGVNIWNGNAFWSYLNKHDLIDKILKNTPEFNNAFDDYVEKMRNDPSWDMEDSDLGPIYGFQWRHWRRPEGGEVDQISNLINEIKTKPGSRYAIMNAWNVGELEFMSLPPCHAFSQFTVTNEKDLDLNMFQRSCDVYLGVPFNIASYALLNHLIAQETEKEPRKFIHSYGNVHVYAGVSPRTNFLSDTDNLRELQGKINSVINRDDYLEVKEWYENKAGHESEGNERKDHIPFILTQLSKEPRELPSLELKNLPFEEFIRTPAKNTVKLNGYKPEKWDSRAAMAV